MWIKTQRRLHCPLCAWVIQKRADIGDWKYVLSPQGGARRSEDCHSLLYVRYDISGLVFVDLNMHLTLVKTTINSTHQSKQF